jgi:hypothetical protein
MTIESSPRNIPMNKQYKILIFTYSLVFDVFEVKHSIISELNTCDLYFT